MFALLLLAASMIASAPTPAARAAELTSHVIPPEKRTQVAVLGTAHLSNLPNTVDLRYFALLVERLAAWQPKLIAIEAISGRQCDMMRRYVDFADTAAQYCFDPAAARAALAMDGPTADAAITTLLATPKSERTAAERRHLAGLFLASGDPASAAVQWLRLPPDERHADANLPASMVALLEGWALHRNEDEVIAVPLAVRLRLERVYPVDDQAIRDPQGPLSDAEYSAGLARIWTNRWAAARSIDDRQWSPAKLTSANAVLAWYRHKNGAKTAELAVRSDFAAAAADHAAGEVGRRYLAYWEIRNLRMVANLREVAGPTPGVRMLAIVGAAHKGFYERYLGQMSDIAITNIETILH